jgi:hypothetical protein
MRARTIVVLDSAQFSGRTTLMQLMSSGTGEWSVHPIDVVSDFAGAAMASSLPDLARLHAADLMSRNPPPTAVVAYCAAATLGGHLVGALADLGQPVAGILVEPSWPTCETIATEFRRLRVNLSADPDEPPWGASATASTLDDMLGVLRIDVERASRTQDLNPRESELFVKAFLTRYRAWLGYLVATAEAPWPDPRCDVGIIAAGSTCRVNADDVVRVPQPRAELFSTPVVREAILDAAQRHAQRSIP